MGGIKLVFGGGAINNAKGFTTPEQAKEVLDVLEAGGVKIIDTAQLYPGSEELIGQSGAGSRFVIDSKVPGGVVPGTLAKESIVKGGKESLKKLGVEKLDVFYIHSPDPNADLAEALAGIQELYEAGGFARFGLSNFKASEVRTVHEHCKTHNYVLPSVYQGNYSPVARRQEAELFPTLRELGIAFYAYSPLAGGFLTKTKAQVLEGAGRFSKERPIGHLYSAMYAKPALLEALAEWESIAKEAGVSNAELAYRWVAFNSPLKEEYGDGVVFGASRIEQVKETIGWLKHGPLDEKACKGIDEVWKKVEHEAPLDNFNR